MQKSFVTVLLPCSAVAAFAQGTVQFSNGALGSMRGMPPTGSFYFGLFYGIGESTSLTFLSTQPGMNSTWSTSVIVNPTDRKSSLNAVQLPGTTPGEADVWIQVKVWDSSFGTDWQIVWLGGEFGFSQIRNVPALGPPTGPGVVIWQGATGTFDSQIPAVIYWTPEPSTLALLGLGFAVRMIARRRK